MKSIFRVVVAALAVALAESASAVHLAPHGIGQALIYPYYTVNRQQQTLFSVTNTGVTPQVLNVRFHEGYNGRTVIDFRIFLFIGDVWTATVFNLRDAGIASDGAGIFTRDLSCTSPLFSNAGTTLADGTPYVSFVDFAYAGVSADGGPTTIQRTREGWFEIIALADLLPPLSNGLQPVGPGGAPVSCAAMQNLVVGPQTTVPSGNLTGTASIINVGQGTILAGRAEALAGFTGRNLLTNTTASFGGLATVNDGPGSSTATARVFDDDGHLHMLTYGGRSGRPIDAVSAVFMADHVQNEYVVSPALAAGSDWVVTMPTKAFYTDPLLTGSPTAALPPFERPFGPPGRSDLYVAKGIYTREEIYFDPNPPCDYSGTCPPLIPRDLGYSSNVLAFSRANQSTVLESPVLGSRLSEPVWAAPSDTGWMTVRLDFASIHLLPASAEGKVLHGLPVIGFWATNLVNNQVSNGVLSNYSAAVRHATAMRCTQGDEERPCE